MEQPIKNRSEQALRFSRHYLIALLIVVVVLGATGLSLMLSPPGAVRNHENLVWWLTPVVLAVTVALLISLRRRRWPSDSPEVRAVAQDEWRRKNADRASRTALIVVLAAQWPLGLILGFLQRLPPARAAMAMATSTITIGLLTMIGLFLIFDRE